MQVNNAVDAGDAGHKGHIANLSDAGHTHHEGQKISKVELGKSMESHWKLTSYI